MRASASWICASAVVVALHASCACAEVWGFIDEAGVPHIAATRIDERYQLFFRGKTGGGENGGDAAEAARAALERTPLYRRVVDHPNVRRFGPLIERTARARGLDPALVKAVIAVESAFDPTALSARGALGLMQIVPATAVRYGIVERRGRTIAEQLLEPATNVEIGVRYLRDLLDLFDNDLSLALAAYNAGEGTVRARGNVMPPYPETRAYVELVREFQLVYAPRTPDPAAPRPRLDLRGARESRVPLPPAPPALRERSGSA
jgi:soluble lytic murein transglycosylase-like protein